MTSTSRTTTVTGFQQCGRCGTFVISSDGTGSSAAGPFQLQLHMKACRKLMVTPRGSSTLTTMRGHVEGKESKRSGGEPKLEDGESMSWVVVTFPSAKVKVRRLGIAEIAGRKWKSQLRFQEQQTSNRCSGASATAILPAASTITGPRQSSLKAKLKIRHAARQMFENKDKGDTRPGRQVQYDEESDSDSEDQHQGDSDDSDDADHVRTRTPKPTATRQRRRRQRQGRRKKSVPPGLSITGVSRGLPKTSDEVYSFHCRKCTAFFNSQPGLEKHVKTVHEDASHRSAVHTCPICDKMMWRRLSFYFHIKNHADAEAIENAFKLWEPWPEPENKGKMRFSCKHCLMPHISHHSYLTHMRTKHQDGMSRDYKWTCRYCPSEEFDRLHSFVRHIRDRHRSEFWERRDHTRNEEPAKRSCDICGELLDTYHLREHKLKEHGRKDKGKRSNPEERRYPCPLCDKSLKTVQLLKEHFISMHIKNNPFTCKFPGCGTRYSNQYSLNRHMGIHTGEETKSVGIPQSNMETTKLPHRPRVDINSIMMSDPVFIKVCKASPEFEKLMVPLVKGGRTTRKIVRCAKCNTLFDNRKGFLQHSRVCRGGTNQVDSSKEISMKFGCPICGFGFDTKELCNRHLEDEHDPGEIFKCEECSEIFPKESTMKLHLSRVHLPRPFPCSKCKKKFTTERSLALHMDRHELQPRTHACPECGKVLSCGSSLQRHRHLVHGIKQSLRGTPGGGVSNKPKKKVVIATKPSEQISRKGKAKCQNVTRDRDHETEAKIEKCEADFQEEKHAYQLVKVEPELIIDPEDEDAATTTTTESPGPVPVADIKIEMGTSRLPSHHRQKLKKEQQSSQSCPEKDFIILGI